MYQRYLNCFVDLWHTCTSQEECESSGHCTDRPWTTIVRSTEHPIDVQFGACFSAGFFEGSHFCYISADRPGIGCRERFVESSDGCHEFEITNDGALWWWRTWLNPAMSEAECVNQNDGRYGCQAPGYEKNLIWMDDEDCECYGGFNTYAWEWTGGIWNNGGVSRTLEWKEIEPVEKYQWTSSLSFELLQTWLETNEEQRFSFAVKSEVICENGYVLSPMNSLVCDCFSDSNEIGGGSQCYHQTTEEQVEELVGISGARSQEESLVKGPSSLVTFMLDSVRTGCTLVNLSVVSEAWFVVPPPRPSISFEFGEKPQRGIVLNHKSATVGTLRGDGSVLHFVKLDNVISFSICLLVNENQTNISKYPVPDFGYSEKPVGIIHPLGILDLNTTSVGGSQFWCGTIIVADFPFQDGNSLRLYPISRIEMYNSEEEEYTSQQTRALMYTLGVCYCICFVLLLFFFINFLRDLKSRMLGVLSFLLLLLCVFRAVFMFGYPNRLFDGNELAEFVVFEIPTFLLFSVVIVSLYFWKSLTLFFWKCFGGDFNYLRVVVFLGLGFVWSLWIVVTIVYAEVILEEDGESPCLGRVAPSYDKQKEDTRTLTIVYQSLIIGVTLFLAICFCYYSYRLVVILKEVTQSKRFVMVIGGAIVLSFLIRCVLFIIILAVEFVSSVYMFITLMITEVFLLFFLQLQFNSPNVKFLGSASISATPPPTSGFSS